MSSRLGPRHYSHIIRETTSHAVVIGALVLFIFILTEGWLWQS